MSHVKIKLGAYPDPLKQKLVLLPATSYNLFGLNQGQFVFLYFRLRQLEKIK